MTFNLLFDPGSDYQHSRSVPINFVAISLRVRYDRTGSYLYALMAVSFAHTPAVARLAPRHSFIRCLPAYVRVRV